MKNRMIQIISVLSLILVSGCSSAKKSDAVASAQDSQDLTDVISELAAKQEEEALAEKAAEEAAAAEEEKNREPEETVTNVKLMEWTDYVDIDLREMSATMIYSEVFNMMMNPDEYSGKKIRIFGMYTHYHSPDDKYYFACIVKDATACCAQGLEFVLNDSYVYPDDYPVDGDEVVVTGIFETYEEGNYVVLHLKDAVIEEHTPRQPG